MGYDTTFCGEFEITPALTTEHRDFLHEFSEDRHDEKGFPGIWCNWEPNDDGTLLTWNEQEKFYMYVDWLQHLVDNYLKPWGYQITGEVFWYGDESDDRGVIYAKDNMIEAVAATISYDPPSWEREAISVKEIE